MSGLSFSASRDSLDNTYGAGHSRSSLTIKGIFYAQGPQTVSDDGGVPVLVDQLFEKFPEVDEIALNRVDSGAVYVRRNSPLSKKRNEPAPPANWERYLQMIDLAGFRPLKHLKLVNQYSPDRENDPWLLIFTKLGHFMIGRRKRVVEINWEGLPLVREVITNDDVTKTDHLVHAWTDEKLQNYLISLYALHQREGIRHKLL